jgi:hypothetical protein
MSEDTENPLQPATASIVRNVIVALSALFLTAPLMMLLVTTLAYLFDLSDSYVYPETTVVWSIAAGLIGAVLAVLSKSPVPWAFTLPAMFIVWALGSGLLDPFHPHASIIVWAPTVAVPAGAALTQWLVSLTARTLAPD